MIEDDSRQHSYLPWHWRSRVNPPRTWCGRIVYKRKPRPYSLKDVQRITNKVSPPVDRGIPPPEDFWTWLRGAREALWELVNRSLLIIPAHPVHDLFDYLIWVWRQRWADMADPFAMIQDKTFYLVVFLIESYGLEQRIRDRYI